MSDFNEKGTVEGTTITASIGFVGDGHLITNLPANELNLGADNVPVITNGTGFLTTESELATVRGGTGLNTSAGSGLSGVAHLVGGVWTFSGITTSDLAAGFSVTNAQTTATPTNTSNTIVSRDSSGGFSAGNIVVTGVTDVNLLTQTAAEISPNGIFLIQTSNLQTMGSAATPVIILPVVNSTVYTIRALISLRDTVDTNLNSGSISYIVKADVNSAGAVAISSLSSYVNILDTNVAAAVATVTSPGANSLAFNVGGLGVITDWIMNLMVLSQA
jgi:hypothetical protein